MSTETNNQIAEKIKQKAIEAAKKKSKEFVRNSILQNPYVWGTVAAILVIILIFYFVASIVSANSEAISQNIVTEKIVPPQIYASDMEDLITSDFGNRTHPVTGEVESFHTGIDIGVPEGTPVQSSFDGVVELVSFPSTSDPETTQNAGIHVVVKSVDPDVAMSSRYLHLSQVFVTTGQAVRKGEIIGLSGNTGRSTGAHLHYELIPEGATEATDPKPYIMLISKLVDVASEEAFKAFRKVNWSSPREGVTPGVPIYESKKMLYLSNIYMENPVTSAFNPTGVGYTKSAVDGSVFGSVTTPGTTDQPPDEEPVSIPVSNGMLTDPFFIQHAVEAQYEEQRSGVPASITLAQAALESGRGQNSICNNLFGIKAENSYKGDFCWANTHEEVDGIRVPTRAKFRAYASAEGSFADHSNFLLRNSRYRFALSKENPYEFANELQKAGYATDSQYANKLKSIIHSQNLASLDMNQGIDPLTGQPFNDVSFVGSGSSGGADDSSGYLTLTFGISQYYGNPAVEVYDDVDYYGKTIHRYRELKSPVTGNSIINMEDYNHMVTSYGNTRPPNLMVKDIPEAIRVTIFAPNSQEFFISKVDYIKGNY